MILLALDLGWRTGWACGSSDAPIKFGTFRTPVRPRDCQDLRFGLWLAWLSNLTRGFAPDAIYYEKAYQRAHQAARVYGGMEALLMTQALALNLRAVGVHSGTIKRETTGKGNASKQAMIEAALAVVGTASELDDNAADAIALLRYAQRGPGRGRARATTIRNRANKTLFCPLPVVLFRRQRTWPD